MSQSPDFDFEKLDNFDDDFNFDDFDKEFENDLKDLDFDFEDSKFEESKVRQTLNAFSNFFAVGLD